jgi:hypothetical protein
MWHTTSSGHHRTVSFAILIVAAVWIVAGVVTVMALDGGLTRGAALLAIVITEWWLVSLLDDRFEGSLVGSKAATVELGVKNASAHASSIGPRAA